MKFQPKISVMIITYNQENLISETIDSVINQDYDNFEIVIADDASTDKTREIIKGYVSRFPDKIIPVFNEVNLGITGNSNAAFFACTGDFIAVLGGDDLFLPGKLKKQIKLFEDVNVVLSYHPVEIFDHHTGDILFITNQSKKEDLNDVYEIISKGGIPGASSVMVRRSSCPEYGFNPKFPVVSDWIFYIEVAMKGRIEKLDGIFGRYRKHGKGASDSSFRLLSESLATLDEIKSIYPNDKKLAEVCKRGGFRYLVGELFRQLQRRDKLKIFTVLDEMKKYTSGANLFWLNLFKKCCNSKLFIFLASSITYKTKNYFKRRWS